MTAPVLHVVDDDDAFHEALLRLLRALHYTVQGHASAEDFLAAAPQDPGCLLLDVRMPGLSGLGLQATLARVNARSQSSWRKGS